MGKGFGQHKRTIHEMVSTLYISAVNSVILFMIHSYRVVNVDRFRTGLTGAECGDVNSFKDGMFCLLAFNKRT